MSFPVLLRKTLYSVFAFIDALLGRSTDKVILCFHGISEDDWRFNSRKEVFIKQIELLLSRGYKFVTLDEVFTATGKNCVLTFDDGYSSVLDITSFIKEKSIPAYMFLISGKYDPEGLGVSTFTQKDFLTPDQIAELISEGWRIGSHTDSHKLLPVLSSDEKKHEIIDSKVKLEQVYNVNVDAISFPRGEYDSQTLEYCKQAGYKYGLTMDDSVLNINCDLLRLPRVGIDRTHSVEEMLQTISPTTISFRKFIKERFSK